jgi:hypothetical protein
VRLATPWYRAFCATVLVAIALAVLAGLAEPDTATSEPNWPGWLFLAVDLVLLFRATRLGLTLTGDTLVVRSWLTTRRFPLADITAVHSAYYDGWWGLNCDCLNQLELELRGREHPVPVRAVVATTRSRRIARIAHQLRQRL